MPGSWNIDYDKFSIDEFNRSLERLKILGDSVSTGKVLPFMSRQSMKNPSILVNLGPSLYTYFENPWYIQYKKEELIKSLSGDNGAIAQRIAYEGKLNDYLDCMSQLILELKEVDAIDKSLYQYRSNGKSKPLIKYLILNRANIEKLTKRVFSFYS